MASYSKSDEFIDLLEEILKDIEGIKKTMDETFKVNVDGGENHVEEATQVDEKNEDRVGQYVISMRVMASINIKCNTKI